MPEETREYERTPLETDLERIVFPMYSEYMLRTHAHEPTAEFCENKESEDYGLWVATVFCIDKMLSARSEREDVALDKCRSERDLYIEQTSHEDVVGLFENIIEAIHDISEAMINERIPSTLRRG